MDKVKTHARICSELTGLYERKNHDYGDSFGKSFTEYGMAMPCIRLEDKLNRLKSLTRNQAAVSDERIEDTLMDLANYAIMTLIEMDTQPVKATPESDSRYCSNCQHCDKTYMEYPCSECFRGREDATADKWEERK